jgi:hypothetical protein
MNVRRIVGMIACCLFSLGIAERAMAQTCGGPVSVQILCCGVKFQVFNYFARSPNVLAGDYNAACPNGASCGNYPSAAGTCLAGSLSTPEMFKKLNEMSQRAPLLVASCTGGLVRYQPLSMNAFDINKVDRKHLLLVGDIKGSGE